MKTFIQENQLQLGKNSKSFGTWTMTCFHFSPVPPPAQLHRNSIPRGCGKEDEVSLPSAPSQGIQYRIGRGMLPAFLIPLKSEWRWLNSWWVQLSGWGKGLSSSTQPRLTGQKLCLRHSRSRILWPSLSLPWLVHRIEISLQEMQTGNKKAIPLHSAQCSSS